MKNDISLLVRDELIQLADEKYQKFASKLIPGCNNMLGVRIPALRKIARRIAKENPYQYLRFGREDFFEEIMLKGLIVGNLNENFNVFMHWFEFFVPKIDNWSVCDTFCFELKIIKQNRENFWKKLPKYYSSNHPYYVRVAIVILLRFFVDAEYLDEIFEILSSIHVENYYVKMAIAWAISVCFAKFSQKTLAFLNKNLLDFDVFQMSLQKIIDSSRVSLEMKKNIKNMKIQARLNQKMQKI